MPVARFIVFVASLAMLAACTVDGNATPANQPVTVTVVKTGGVAGVHKQVVDTDLDNDARTRLRELVSSREFTDLDYTVATPPCCDGFVYTVTVDYDAGTQKVVTAYDLQNDTPEVLEQIVAVVKPALR
jgi:hypothetical protein